MLHKCIKTKHGQVQHNLTLNGLTQTHTVAHTHAQTHTYTKIMLHPAVRITIYTKCL